MTLKTFALAAALVSLTAAHAGNMSCEGNWKDHFSLKFEGNLIGDWIKNAKATAKDDENTIVGRAAQLSRDANYTPRKYKNHVRYSLSKLTEVENFGSFGPYECNVSVMIPENAAKKSSFSAPVVVNCDQDGGSFTMKCTQELSDN